MRKQPKFFGPSQTPHRTQAVIVLARTNGAQATYQELHHENSQFGHWLFTRKSTDAVCAPNDETWSFYRWSRRLLPFFESRVVTLSRSPECRRIHTHTLAKLKGGRKRRKTHMGHLKQQSPPPSSGVPQKPFSGAHRKNGSHVKRYFILVTLSVVRIHNWFHVIFPVMCILR